MKLHPIAKIIASLIITIGLTIILVKVSGIIIATICLLSTFGLIIYYGKRQQQERARTCRILKRLADLQNKEQQNA